MDDLIMIGGMYGEYTFMNLQTCMDPVRGSMMEVDIIDVVNAIEISRSRTGGMMHRSFC